MESKNVGFNEKVAEMLRWAKQPIEHVEAVRSGAFRVPEGQTPEFYVRKYLLSSIPGDDSQILSFQDDYFVPELTGAQKESAMMRLGFEIVSTEIPQEIREKLEKFRGSLEETDISDKKRYLKMKDGYGNLAREVQRYMTQDKSFGTTFLT
jgi:hypothetical protein